MPRKIEGDGVIQVVCSRCGFTYHEYVIGSSGNKNKYIGPPTPAKALSGFDGRVCPICGKPASVERPRGIIFLTEKEYERKIRVVDVKSMSGGVLMKFVIVDGVDDAHAIQVKRAVEEAASSMYPGAPSSVVQNVEEAGEDAAVI